MFTIITLIMSCSELLVAPSGQKSYCRFTSFQSKSYISRLSQCVTNNNLLRDSILAVFMHMQVSRWLSGLAPLHCVCFVCQAAPVSCKPTGELKPCSQSSTHGMHFNIKTHTCKERELLRWLVTQKHNYHKLNWSHWWY